MLNGLNKTANSYESAAVIPKEVRARLLDKLSFIKISPSIILNLGCATGEFSHDLTKQYPDAKIIALDISVKRLKCVRPNININCVNSDFEKLPIKSNSIDLIIVNLSFHYNNDLEKLFTNLKKIIKPEGLLLFSCYGTETLQELREAWLAIDNYTHINNFSDMHDIGDALLHAGFQDPVMDQELLTIEYSNINSLLQDLKQQGETNINPNRAKFLYTRNKINSLLNAYQKTNNASFKIIYGLAWKAKAIGKYNIDIPVKIQ